jgi:sporulation protein YlmC with PRC-barrel domain
MIEEEQNYETDNRSGTNHEGADANRPVERLTATSIIGDALENNKGQDLGKISDLMINLDDGTVEYAVIESGGVLGVGKKLFAIPFGQMQINEDKELFVIDRDKEYIKNSPGFDPSHWPGTNDHKYLDNVNSYFEPPVTPFP